MTTVRTVFDSITHCPNVALCRSGDASHPCYTIVNSQHAAAGEFQLPEPWRGEIDKARLLFVGSNPSIGDDRFSLESSSEEQIWESQHLAFGGGSRPYVLDGTKTTHADGSAGHNVPYWSSIRARAHELMPSAVPGTDYAITEVVHCKSKGEEGVLEAAQTCYGTHMASVFSVSAAPVVVVLGKVAREQLLGAGAEIPSSPLEMELGGRARSVVFLPHPNARGDEKSLAAHYSAADLDKLRALLAAA